MVSMDRRVRVWQPGAMREAGRSEQAVIEPELLAAAVAAAEARYRTRRPRSAALAAEAAAWLPGGNTRSVLHFDPFPFRLAGAEGAEVVDVDGHRYVDLLGNYSAGLLGHHPEEIGQVLAQVAASGLGPGVVAPVEAEAARLVCERFASIDRVRFTNSGTEANLMAIATAQHHTGRRKVVVCRSAYHGGVLYFGVDGEPLLVPHPWLVAEFNDADSFRRFFASDGDEIACVLIEPMMGAAGCIPPQPGFLQTLRELCDAAGALLIFDEVMASRLDRGGAQGRFGVTSDMTTLGKYMAGGFNFGAFGGSKEVMAAFDPGTGGMLSHGGTFNNNPLTMAGVVATLGAALRDHELDQLNERGDRLRHQLGDVLGGSNLPLSVSGLGSLLAIHATPVPPLSPPVLGEAARTWQRLLFFHLLEAGYYVAPRGFIALRFDVRENQLDGFVAAVAGFAADPFRQAGAATPK